MICILLILLGALLILLMTAYVLGLVIIGVAVSNFVDILCEKVRKLIK